MIAELFEPIEIECLVSTAVELWETEDAGELSERQQEVLNRARNAVYEEQAGRPLPYPAVTSLLPRTQEDNVWVLNRWDKHEAAVISLHADKASGLESLAEHVRSSWDNLADVEGVPDYAPADDREAVDYYYQGDLQARWDEGYSIFSDSVRR